MTRFDDALLCFAAPAAAATVFNLLNAICCHGDNAIRSAFYKSPEHMYILHQLAHYSVMSVVMRLMPICALFMHRCIMLYFVFY